MTRQKNPRCKTCGRRPRRNQPYLIVVNRESGAERCYHAREECWKLGVEQTRSWSLGFDVYNGVGAYREYNCSVEGPGLPPEVLPMSEVGAPKITPEKGSK